MRTCTKCGETKPLDEFYFVRRGSETRQARCKVCQRQEEKDRRASRTAEERTEIGRRGNEWRKAHPGKAAEYSRKVRHGTSERFFGPCYICGVEGPLDVDHDRRCCPGPKSCAKCRRGLLCHSCNAGLGYFRDDPTRLRLAIDYLDDPPGLVLPDEDLLYRQRVRKQLKESPWNQ